MTKTKCVKCSKDIQGKSYHNARGGPFCQNCDLYAPPEQMALDWAAIDIAELRKEVAKLKGFILSVANQRCQRISQANEYRNCDVCLACRARNILKERL